MIISGVAFVAAIHVPSGAATAAADFAGFLDGAAFGAYGTYVRRGESWCLYADIGRRQQEENDIRLLVLVCGHYIAQRNKEKKQ